MSIRTAIEINHDYSHKQTREPERMAQLIFDAIYFPRSQETWDALQEFGITKVYQCHHSDDRLEAHKAQSHPANFRRTP